MNARNWEKIKETFAQVLEIPQNQRADFLSRICGDDGNLRAEIESLLGAYDETQQHLIENQEFAAAPLFETNGTNYAGKRFGNYKIIREIGRGGMGAVFLAQRSDGEFNQQVALKIVRQTFADADLERHFRRERQILASLNHPNIAKLLDGGVSDAGEPFIAMEFIEGEPILDFAEKRNLEIEDRLRLFLKVCDAVSYAHRNLIIHRDIKPLNILVDKYGEPKLLDFGLAKIFDENLLDVSQTETAFRAFTPAYASPEQMRGKNITTASDVYSLGVVFYELLTGERPFQFGDKSYEEILRSIDTQEPPPPSSVISRPSSFVLSQSPVDQNATAENDGQQTADNGQRTTDNGRRTNPQSLRGDLDNIALMALRREPERRYPSVEQFAGDIERHLQGLPITARPQTISYRASKFIRRNKIAVAAAGFVVLALMTGLTVALWQANVARQQRSIAEKRFNDVRRLSNALLNDIAPKIERLEGSTEARQALVEQSLKYLDSLAVESADDAGLQAELAAAYETVGVLQGDARKPGLSDFPGSIASLEKAQAIRRRLLELNPDEAENRRLLAENLRLLGARRISLNEVEASFRDNREGISIYEKLVAENPGSLKLQRALLSARVESATGYADINKFAEAVPLLQQAVGNLEELRLADADDAETAGLLANCLGYLGFSLSWESRQAEAETAMTRAVEITEALAARHPNDANFRQDLWRIYQMAAGIYDEVDNARGFELCEKARRIAEETIALDRANAQARHNLVKTFARLAQFASNLEKPDESLAYLNRAAEILSELQARDPLSRAYDHDSGSLYKRIGTVKHKKGDLAGALEAYEKTRAVFEKRLENDDSETNVMRNLGFTFESIGSAHADFVKITGGETRQTHLEAAKNNYRRALDVLQMVESRNALPEFDRKSIEEMRAALEKLEKNYKSD